MKALFWLSLVSGAAMMLYSTNTMKATTPIYNIQSLNNNVYQAQVTCSRSFLLGLLKKCEASHWLLPPVCPFIDGPNAERVQSWSPVVFECQNRAALKPYLGYRFDNNKSIFFWNLGLFLFFVPLMAVCGMFLLIGVYQYFKRKRSVGFEV